MSEFSNNACQDSDIASDNFAFKNGNYNVYIPWDGYLWNKTNTEMYEPEFFTETHKKFKTVLTFDHFNHGMTISKEKFCYAIIKITSDNFINGDMIEMYVYHPNATDYPSLMDMSISHNDRVYDVKIELIE